jgi:hypothetical protein
MKTNCQHNKTELKYLITPYEIITEEFILVYHHHQLKGLGLLACSYLPVRRIELLISSHQWSTYSSSSFRVVIEYLQRNSIG